MIHPDDTTTILCYGDSNTFGYVPGLEYSRYSKKTRWTGVLSELLGRNYEVIEEGLNGRTTAYDRDELPFKNGLVPFKAILCSHKPIDLVILMLGTNDCNSEMNLEPLDIKKGLEKLVKIIKEEMVAEQEYAPEVLIVSPAPILKEIKGTPFEDQLDETSIEDSLALGKLYKELAEEYDCLYFDAKDIEVSTIDCEHLTVQGHHDLAHALYKVIKEKF